VDNSAEASPEPALTQRWATPLPVVVVGWLAAVGALAWCLLAGADAPGRLLIGVAAAACGFLALYGTAVRPRLAADARGVRVRGLTGTMTYDWAAVESLHVVMTRRWGRSVPTLELDTRRGAPDRADTTDADGPPERLHIFGWLDLGADPRDVADTLRRLRRP
jgi:hypothetical protein